MHQHRYHIKLTKDYEETEGSQMLKDPKETSPTLLFFLSVFHNIAANFHSRNTSNALSHLSTEQRERERDCRKHTETKCGVRKSRRQQYDFCLDWNCGIKFEGKYDFLHHYIYIRRTSSLMNDDHIVSCNVKFMFIRDFNF